MNAWGFLDKHIKLIVLVVFVMLGLVTGAVTYDDIKVTAQRYVYMSLHLCK
jgi:hypothetical protein